MLVLSTRTLALRQLRLCLFVLLMLSYGVCAAINVDQRQPLQTLGAQIKLAVDQASLGVAPTPAALAQFERVLGSMRSASGADSNPALVAKRHAIELLFAKLKYLAAQPALQNAANVRALLASSSNARAAVDIETVASGHGDACAAALGITQSLPVQLSLAQAGHGKSDAWVRFEPASSGHARFTTDSSGADPAIEIFSSCDDAATAMAANDDDIGLDAAVAVATTAHKPLMLHVSNSGQAGTLKIAVVDANGTISGAITDLVSGLPVVSADVRLFDSTQNYYAYTFTDQDGFYSIAAAPGTYYVFAIDDGYVRQLYPAVLCSGSCEFSQAQSVTLTDSASITNINLALSHGQRILGQVRDTSNQPLAGTVNLYDSSGAVLRSSGADNFGHYSFSTLPPGNYKLSADVNGYASQMFDHLPCGGLSQTVCDLSQANVVTISTQDVAAINFDIPVPATIQGVVTLKNSSLSLYSAQLTLLDHNGSVINQAVSDYTDGYYKIGPLAPGSYYIYASTNGFFSQIFNGIGCAAQNCSGDLANATPINISAVGQQVQVDFHLDPWPTIHGHVQDAASGLPLANILVQAMDFSLYFFFVTSAASARTNSTGDYSLPPLAPAQYAIYAQSNDYVDQLYSGVICDPSPFFVLGRSSPSCNSSAATFLNVTPTQVFPAINFALTQSSSIAGKVTLRAGIGSNLPAVVQVTVYNSAGNAIKSANSDMQGNYIINDLVPATYFVAVNSNYNPVYVGQVWQQMDCSGNCSPTTGTAVVLGQGTKRQRIDFLLTRYDALVGRVTGPMGMPVSGVLIDLFAVEDNSYQGSGVTNSQGYYAALGNIGSSYYLDSIFKCNTCERLRCCDGQKISSFKRGRESDDRGVVR
jgi:hypothetical protein